jgi:hypothetical protein
MSDIAILQQLEPMIVHLLEKPTFDGVSRYRTDDRINATFGAKCSVVVVRVHNTPEIGWIALYPCGALSLNDASLAMVREAATNGED